VHVAPGPSGTTCGEVVKLARLEPCAWCGVERYWLRTTDGIRRVEPRRISRRGKLLTPADREACCRCDDKIARIFLLPGWLPDTPIWPELQQYFVLEKHRPTADNKEESETYFRMELDVPVALRARLLRIRVECLHCKAYVHPFRLRQGDGRGRLYYSSVCGLRKNLACSRGDAVRTDHARLVASLGGVARESARQGTLWGL